MHTTRAFIALSVGISLFLVGCSGVPQVAEKTLSNLSGCWYGEDYQPLFGDKAGWLMNRKEDGTFSIEFRTIEVGHRLPIHSESGEWKFENGKYITITKIVAGKIVNPYYVDEYEIRSLNHNGMVYYHAGAKQEFSSRKVSCDYQAAP